MKQFIKQQIVFNRNIAVIMYIFHTTKINVKFSISCTKENQTNQYWHDIADRE